MEKNKIDTGISSDARKEPRRVVFVTKKTSAKVVGDPGAQLMTYPHLLIREAIAFQVLVIAMVLVALLWTRRSSNSRIRCLPRMRPRPRGIFSASRNCCTFSRHSWREY